MMTSTYNNHNSLEGIPPDMTCRILADALLSHVGRYAFKG